MIDMVPPPHNQEAEQAVLGSMLLDRNAITKAREFLRPADFYVDKHGLIFSTIVEMFERDEPVDLVTITDRLHDKGQLDSVGGPSYLTGLLKATATPSNIGYYADIVGRKSRLRSLGIIGATLRPKDGDDPDVILAELDQAIDTVRGNYAGNMAGLVRAAQLTTQSVEFVIEDLLLRRMLTLLSGRDKIGKTLLAMEMMRAVLRGFRLFGHFRTNPGVVAGFFLDDPEGLTKDRLESLGITKDSGCLISTSQRADLHDPLAFLRHVGHAAVQCCADLVVLDALYLFVPIGQNVANDQARMAPVMGLLNSIAERSGAAVLIIAHDSKNGADVAGSHVIRAAAKNILRLTLPTTAVEDPDEGPTTPQRVLRLESKLIPATAYALELRGVGDWLFRGNPREARTGIVRDEVEKYLAAGAEGTGTEIAEALDRRRVDVEAALRVLIAEGKVVCEGQGSSSRGRPRGIYRAVRVSVPRGNFRPDPPDRNSGDKSLVYQGDSRSPEFPSGFLFSKGGSGTENRQAVSVPPSEAPSRSTVPAFDDDARRAVVVRMGELLGWRAIEFKPGVSIAAGEEHWRTFSAVASAEDLTLALQALERIQ
jgi:hypothetical protein